MDNETDYGKCFFHMSYKEAIEQNIISDYKILTVTVSGKRVRQLIEKNHILNLNLRDLDGPEAQSVATGIALKRVFKKHDIKHAISFHRSIRAADCFRKQQDALNRVRELGPKTINFHISSKKTAGERSELLREFCSHKRALITNARCLTEGVDVPEADCVVFADPKQSRIDIVQAAGRALRLYPGKLYGYILLPLIVPPKMTLGEFAESTAFREIVSTITALSTLDERIAEEFRAIDRGRVPTGKIVEIEGDVPVGMKIDAAEFAKAISTRIWESVGRANWRTFEDARAFAQSLGLERKDDWIEYSKTSKKPADIPANPNTVYTNKGWVGWGDWVGTGRRRGNWRPFKEARAFVRSLRLKKASDWLAYCSSGEKPADIPTTANLIYAEDGWVSLADWLGSDKKPRGRPWRSFKKARAFVHTLRLRSVPEWFDYCRSGKRPSDIPSNPNLDYAKLGWASWGDWLGTGTISNHGRRYRSFKKARSFVHSLGFKSLAEWSAYCQSGKKPADLPVHPERAYARDGWVSVGDWLGTGRIADQFRKYRSFYKARAFVRGLKLKSQCDWRVYCKSGTKPNDIPANPSQTYAEAGWAGMGDWLGTGRRRGNGWRPFREARAYVRTLGLKTCQDWIDYCKSGKKPNDIPAGPSAAYAKDGWAGTRDWLGTSTVVPLLRRDHSFKKARRFTRGIKFSTEGRASFKSGKKRSRAA